MVHSFILDEIEIESRRVPIINTQNHVFMDTVNTPCAPALLGKATLMHHLLRPLV